MRERRGGLAGQINQAYLDSVIRFIEQVRSSKVAKDRIGLIVEHVVGYNSGKVRALPKHNKYSAQQ